MTDNRTAPSMRPALVRCIGCGCDDRHPCSETDRWVRADYARLWGVCSRCHALVSAWDAKDREPSTVALAVQARLALVDSRCYSAG